MTPKSYIRIFIFSLFLFIPVITFSSFDARAQEQEAEAAAKVETEAEKKPSLEGVGVSVTYGNTEERMRPLTSVEEEEGFKALLHHCARVAAQKLGVEGGFGNNPDAYIPMPVSLQHLEYTLREAGENKIIDGFLSGMNKAAEASIPKVAGFFLLAVGQLRTKDVEAVKDDKNVSAATLQLHRRMAQGLIDVARPVIEESVENYELPETYTKMTRLYHKHSYTKKVSLVLENYMIEKVLEEFFVTMSKEEQALRANPDKCPEPKICMYLTGETKVKTDFEDIGLEEQ